MRGNVEAFLLAGKTDSGSLSASAREQILQRRAVNLQVRAAERAGTRRNAMSRNGGLTSSECAILIRSVL